MPARKWKRREAGSYIAEIDGVRVVIVNMQGESILYSGIGRHWIVREGGEGEYDIASHDVHAAWTLADAKQWSEEKYGRVRQ